MHLWHVTISASGRNPLFLDDRSRLDGVRGLARVASRPMVLFSLMDEHIHVVMVGDRRYAGQRAKAISLSIRPHVTGHLQPARFRPVESRVHMKTLVRYVLDQPRHHGLPVHSALWSGSCFPDLIGARCIPGFQLCIRDVLPRFRMRDAYRAVGLPETPLALLGDREVRLAGAGRLVEAAAACLCEAPPLSGNRHHVMLARIAVARVARSVGIRSSEVMHALNVGRCTVSRLSRRPIHDRILTGVRLRLALDNAVHQLAVTRCAGAGVIVRRLRPTNDDTDGQ